MEICFSWERDGGYRPECYSSVINKDGVSLLACLLTDDGGQGYGDTVPWLNEGLSRIKSVKEKAATIADWSRDAWGAEFRGEQARIYSLYDEDYVELWNLSDFEKILLAWRDFLQSGPSGNLRREIVI